MNIPSFKQKYLIYIFVVISYLITWLITFPLVFYYNTLDNTSREIWHTFGSIGPAISGIIVVYLIKGKKGLIGVYDRISKGAGIKLILLSLSPIIIFGVTILIEIFSGFFNPIQFIQENGLIDLFSWIIFILPIICYGFFEEIGWRGFLLPKLQSRYNALKSTLILTLIWWFWHLPFFFYRYNLFFALVIMFPLLLSGSIFITNIYNQSGSLLMTIIFHISYNTVNAHEISILSVIFVSMFIIFMSIRAIKVYGIEDLAERNSVKFD